MLESAGECVLAPVLMALDSGRLAGARVREYARTLAYLTGMFRDEAARAEMPAEAVVYRVQAYFPVPEGTEGGLFWGNTVVEAGRVADEYFMTRGHFHARRDRGEFYVGVAGEGGLILMDESRRTWWEPMRPGTVHYISGHTAHRVANTGTEPLTFLACWPGDAGHDYTAIEACGFSARLRDVDGKPTLIACRG